MRAINWLIGNIVDVVVGGILWAIGIYVFRKLPSKLGENAVISWMDDRIGETLGVSSPTLDQIITFGWDYLLPAVFAFLILWAYHVSNNRASAPESWRRHLIGLALVALGITATLYGASLLASPPRATANDKEKSPGAPPSAAPTGKRFTSYDVEARLRAIDALDDAMSKLQPLVQKGQNDLLNNIDRYVRSGEAADILLQYANQAKAAWDQINSGVGDYQSRFPDIARTISLYPNFHIAAGLASNTFNLRQEVIRWQGKDQMLQHLQSSRSMLEFRQSVGALSDYTSSTRNELALKRREYESAEVYDRGTQLAAAASSDSKVTNSKYRWDPLTSAEVTEIRSKLRKMPPPPMTRVMCGDSDCRELADSLMGLFSGLNWQPAYENQLVSGTGITVLYKDGTYDQIADAVELSTNGRLKIDLQPHDLLPLRVTIGRKPQ
jgi:hypothetical protein